MKKTLLICFLVLYQVALKAEGYQVNLQSQRQIGMGHTGTGLSLSASSMHFNPGALAQMSSKYDFSGGANVIFSHNTFQKQSPSLYQAESDNPVGTPFFFYGAGKVSDKLVVGLSVTTPYGNSLKWGDNWDGRYLIQDISLKAIFLQPTVSYKIVDNLSIGAGFVVAYGDVNMSKALPLMDQNGKEGAVHLSGNTISYGFNAGVYYKPVNDLSIGINYRSKVVMKVEGGDAIFNVPASLSGNFPKNNKFTAELPMPANLTLGLGWQVSEKLLLAADFQYVFWSAYEDLSFDFEQNTETLSDSYNPRNFENSMVYRLGAEYELSKSINLRAGIYYDETPIQEGYLTPETPGTNKIGLSAGVSWYVTEKLSIDASVLYIHGEDREDGYQPANFYGTYASNAFIPGIGVSYSF